MLITSGSWYNFIINCIFMALFGYWLNKISNLKTLFSALMTHGSHFHLFIIETFFRKVNLQWSK